jgi:1,4-alpha-glucan branching enzyme
MALENREIASLLTASHPHPHHILGLHPEHKTGYLVITVFKPELATKSAVHTLEILDSKTKKALGKLKQLSTEGLYSLKLRRKKRFCYQLRLTTNSDGEVQSIICDDAFAFSSHKILGELDLYLLNEGKHQSAYKKLGAHLTSLTTISGRCVAGCSFSVWAPNASHVAVIGDFNNWDGRCHPMNNSAYHDDKSGYWTLFVPAIIAGAHYKFEIKDRAGNLLPAKADPYGIQAQYRPDTASIVAPEKNYPWQDQQWLNERARRNSRDAAISIYEVQLGSWQRDENNHYLNYRAIAEQLIPYTLEMGFTHIQLMPVSEFPFDGSWGYQPVGLFAPSARFGTAEDFQYFVDQCHQANLGLLIDWVPGHFPSDAHGLAQFDGSHLYEHADPRQGFHPDWNTLIYNYGRVEVANFLRASALHWLDSYHIDGIRVDAVASMLYLDYSRKEGEWIPNKHGGRENLEAVDFLQRFNEELYALYPGTFSVAEESTSWPGVSRPTSEGGLGFGYKWNMGWMNDSLEYMKRDPVHRQHHHNELSFGLVYAFDENFVLPLSHDEVVHGKGSLIARMPGDAWQQFANLRAYYGFMWAHPGKKLLFMGCEFAQGREWNHDQALDWHQLDIHWHSGVQRLVKDLNKVYTSTPALHQQDCQQSGFTWLDHENAEQSIYSFIRYGDDRNDPVIVVCNFSANTVHDFLLGVPVTGHYQELINTDLEIYAGSGQGNINGVTSKNRRWQGQPHSIQITVPPMATVIFRLKESDADILLSTASSLTSPDGNN